MKSIFKFILTSLVAASVTHSAQAVNMVQVDGAHTTFFYDADFWGLNTASVVGDKIAFLTPSYFNQRAEGYGVRGEDSDRYTNESSSAVIAVARAGYQLTGGVDYDLTTTYAQPNAGAFASYINTNTLNAGVWDGSAFQVSSSVSYFDLFISRGSASSGVGSGTTHTVDSASGVLGSYQALALNSYLFLISEQKGAGYSEAGLSAASYQFGVSAVPEPTTYGMLIGGLVLVGLADSRRRRKLFLGSALLAAGFVGNAQAVNYVEVVGNHVSFFYDSDYWGSNAANVVGDKIVLSTPAYVNRTATGNSPSERNERIYTDSATSAVVAVAHNGYAMTGAVGFKLDIAYSISAEGSNVVTAGGDNIFYGTFNNGAFTNLGLVGWHTNSNSVASNGSAQTGVTNFATESGNFSNGGPSVFDMLGIDNTIYLSAIQQGVGTTKAAVTYSYDFATITAVPEPATYGMLLGGLGLIGMFAHRRARKAA